MDVLESIHRNFPETINRYRANGVTGAKWDAEMRRKLRKANVNSLTAVADGTVYMPIGGRRGVMSGIKMEAMKEADYGKTR
jgi:hypothetical protein